MLLSLVSILSGGSVLELKLTDVILLSVQKMLLKRLVRETSTSEIKAPMTFPGLKDSEQNRFFGRKKIDFALKPKLLLNLLKLLLQKTQTFVYKFLSKKLN